MCGLSSSRVVGYERGIVALPYLANRHGVKAKTRKR
jgi:hypothetical protein